MDNFRKAHKMSRIKTMRLRKDNNPNLKIKLKQILRGYLNNDTSSIRRYADFTDVSTQEDTLESDLDNSFYQSGITIEQSSSARSMKNENSIQDFTGTKTETEENKSTIKKVNGIEQLPNENQAVLNDFENGGVTTQNTSELYTVSKYEDINSKMNMSVTVKDKVKKKTKKLKENKNSQKNFIGPKFREATKRNLKSIKGVTKVEHSFGCSSIDSEEKFDKSGKLASKILKRLPKIQKKTTDYSVDADTSSMFDLDFSTVASSSSSNSSSKIFHEQRSPSLIGEIESYVNNIDTDMSDVSVENIKDIESFFTTHGTKEINTYRHSVLDQTHKNIVDFFRNKSLPADAEIFPANICSNSSANDDSSVTSEVIATISKIESSLLEEDMEFDNTDTNIPPRFYRIKKGCIVVLSHQSRLYFHGKLKATILCGHVEIFGYKLTDQPCHIYASQCSYSLYFEAFPYVTSTYGLFSKLTSIGFPVIQTEDIVTSLSAHDSIIYLEELNDGTVDFLINNFNSSPLFYTSSSEFGDVFQVPRDALQCAMYKYKPAKSLQDNSMWVQVVNHAIGTTSKTLICGGKDVGKSTLMRYYINKLLAQSSVAVIDLDPGQCEFTICGNVSVTVIDKPLIGVNFTHLQEPKRILNIGMINVTNNIEKYINAMQEIMVFCKEDKAISALPWVINTMGMIDSLGLELIAFIVKLFEPTIVVQIKCNVPKRNFTMAITPENLQVSSIKFKSNFNCSAWLGDVSNRKVSYNYFLVKQEIHGNENKHAKQQRYLSLLAYFGQISTSGFLNAVKPFMVPIDSIKIGLNEELHELYKKVINGKVVVLGFDDNSEHKMGSVFKLGVEPLICYGHGLVRGIDNESGRMYIITPLSVKKLRLVNTVVYSDILPDLALNNTCYRPDTFVPYCANLIRKSRYRQLMNSPKRRFNPLQLLNVKKGS